jgi:hypothetical protein
MAESPFQNALYVPQVIHQLGKNDVIECLLNIRFMNIGFEEVKLRVADTASLDHFLREVHSHTARGLERGQQISLTTPEFKHTHIGRN